MLALKKCSEHDVLVKTGGYFQGIYFFFPNVVVPKSALLRPTAKPTNHVQYLPLPWCCGIKKPFCSSKSVAHPFQSTSFALQKTSRQPFIRKEGSPLQYRFQDATHCLHQIPLKETQLRFASVGFNSVLLACSCANTKTIFKAQSLSLEQEFFSALVSLIKVMLKIRVMTTK